MISEGLEQYIKELSLNDKKTLTQKSTKLFEEGGELAKKILGYDGIYGSNHRMVTKEDLLEELVDVFLVNMSMVYDLDISKEKFEAKLFEKAQIWNGLQVKEDRSLSKSELMPYEIHITVNAEDGIDIEKYRIDCKEIGVKPIVLDLQDRQGTSVMDDVMTSSKIYGTNSKAFDEMKRISNTLTEFGYNVIREKIEASYWHQKAPFKEDGDTEMPEGCYFECHLNILCTYERMKQLSEIAKRKLCHLSKNAFKKFPDGTFTIMMTFRSYNMMYESFEQFLESIKKDLIKENFSIEKEVVEFSIYDTKLEHDNKWLLA